MVSLRNITECVTGKEKKNISILHDFFGYLTGVHFDNIWVDPAIGYYPNLPSNQLSVRRQIKLVQGPHFNLCIIRVAYDESFWDVREEWITTSLQQTRNTFATVGVGIGLITHWKIPGDLAGDYDMIDDDSEAIDLMEEWNAPAEGVDCFIVPLIAPEEHSMGKSVQGGPCDKEGKGADGVVASVQHATLLGHVIAHELGHYVGNLPDLEPAPGTFGRAMDGLGNAPNTFFTASEGAEIRSSCWIRQGC